MARSSPREPKPKGKNVPFLQNRCQDWFPASHLHQKAKIYWDLCIDADEVGFAGKHASAGIPTRTYQSGEQLYIPLARKILTTWRGYFYSARFTPWRQNPLYYNSRAIELVIFFCDVIVKSALNRSERQGYK